jgi:hypothetical protein
MQSVRIRMSRRTADAAGKNGGGVMNKSVLFCATTTIVGIVL